MCGIFCCVSNDFAHKSSLQNEFDSIKTNISQRGPDHLEVKKFENSHTCGYFVASVLWLQGKTIKKQPLEDDKSIFIYNGDVFGGSIDEKSKIHSGDTTLFHDKITKANSISIELSKIYGPYAFLYFDKKLSKLYFGRDVYGRRSLLIGFKNNKLILTSVSKRKIGHNLIELPSIGTFCYDFIENTLTIFPWQYKNQNFNNKLEELRIFLGIDIKINLELPNIENNTFIEPKDADLELLNSLNNLNCDTAFEKLLSDDLWLKKVLKLKELLEEAIRKRISTQPAFCKNCVFTDTKMCNHSTTGVLFSGGIDCAILAILADKYVYKKRPIDLINVAFDEKKDYKTPDRITGLETLEELHKINPDRNWKFLEVNVTTKELDFERKNTISDLIYPLETILDDSLGCALWFASRGQTEKYVTPCRVLLVGMGADELFGGYTRHRAALNKEGWRGLHEMLDVDWQNISHRNLARDDRVVSDHGRQLRTPYLDEDLVNFVRSLNSWERTCPSRTLPQGFGEKILLRSLGYYLGLKNASTFKKRALQFGSRIANPKENAHDKSVRLCC